MPYSNETTLIPSLFTHFHSTHQVRNFILELSMDQQVEQVLSTRRCEQCGTATYEANLTCHNCKVKLEPCSVSG